MSQRRQGDKFERIVASDIDARFQPGSGCLWFAKGDVRNQVFLVECKSSDNNGRISLDLDWFSTIRHHANQEERFWALAFTAKMTYSHEYGVAVDLLIARELFDDDVIRAASRLDCQGKKQITYTQKQIEDLYFLPNIIHIVAPTGLMQVMVMSREKFKTLNTQLIERSGI